MSNLENGSEDTCRDPNEENHESLSTWSGLSYADTQRALSSASSDLMMERSESKSGFSKLIPLTRAVQASGPELPNSLKDSIQNFLYGSRRFRVFIDRVRAYARKHPYLLTAQILGISSILASIIMLPILGFGELGPVADSLATVWQSSIGVVRANSLFSLLQSAGMSGAAAGLFIGGGVAGGLVASGATVVAVMGGWKEVKGKSVGLARSVVDMGKRLWRSFF